MATHPRNGSIKRNLTCAAVTYPRALQLIRKIYRFSLKKMIKILSCIWPSNKNLIQVNFVQAFVKRKSIRENLNARGSRM